MRRELRATRAGPLAAGVSRSGYAQTRNCASTRRHHQSSVHATGRQNGGSSRLEESARPPFSWRAPPPSLPRGVHRAAARRGLREGGATPVGGRSGDGSPLLSSRRSRRDPGAGGRKCIMRRHPGVESRALSVRREVWLWRHGPVFTRGSAGAGRSSGGRGAGEVRERFENSGLQHPLPLPRA